MAPPNITGFDPKKLAAASGSPANDPWKRLFKHGDIPVPSHEQHDLRAPSPVLALVSELSQFTGQSTPSSYRKKITMAKNITEGSYGGMDDYILAF
ncbi:hypothetical protein EG327_004635 [Venturia inaequalis]|uniref:Uncharacterized protein n=1 Tax=Venturia inaequalis TaxID=5025 RepID=A0A8H3VBN2_VENIN|nr:hypothetical protein EG327_004635 [Venturia inaequalis]